jgi:hypothetical protein
VHVYEVDPGCLEGLLHRAEELRVGGQHQVRHVSRAGVCGLVAVLLEDVIALSITEKSPAKFRFVC